MLLKIIQLAFLIILVANVIACGDSRSSGSSYDSGDIGEGGGLSTTGPPKQGKALLGPVVNASVRVYGLFDRENPLCVTTSQRSSDLDVAGTFTLPENCIVPDKLYLVEVSGGQDIDADDDGVVDDEPTPVEGSFHAFVSGQQMIDEVWQVTAVSEAMFQSVQNLLDLGASEEEVRQFLEDIVPLFLAEDLNGDGKIDTDDILQFNPQIHFQSVSKFSESHLRKTIDEIHLAENNTFKEVAIEGDIVGHFDTLSAATRVYVDDKKTAYVATKTAMLVIDVSTPDNPILLGAYPTGWIYDLVVVGNLAYIGLGPLGMQLVDISDPSSPKALGRSEQSAYRLDVSNQRVFYISERDDAKTIEFGYFDASEPQSPAAVELFTIDEGWAMLSSFKMQDDLAIISTSSLTESDTYIIRLQTASTDLPGVFTAELLDSIAVELSNHAILDVTIVETDDAINAFLAVGQIDFYTLAFSQTLLAYDISDTPYPLRGENLSSIAPVAVDAYQDTLLVWEENQLRTFDISSLVSGSQEIPDPPTSIDSTEIIDLVDVTQATAETLLSIYSRTLEETLVISSLDDTFNFAGRIFVRDGYTYLAGGRYGLLIVKFPGEL